jgi:hypothetical protein
VPNYAELNSVSPDFAGLAAPPTRHNPVGSSQAFEKVERGGHRDENLDPEALI